MWVSRKEFVKLLSQLAVVTEGLKFSQDEAKTAKVLAFEAKESIARLTKQMKCSCENYEVESRPLHITQSKLVGKHLFTLDRTVEERYFKICRDCGFVTQYDTEEDALADKQALLDKQIDTLKEQKKSLKKK